MSGELIRLFKRVGGGARFAVLLALRAPFDALYTFVQASFLGFCFDAINRQDTALLARGCLVFTLSILVLFLYNGTVWTIYSPYVVRIVARLRRMLFGHITALSLRQVDERPSGEWQTRLGADVHAATAILWEPLHLPHLACATVNIIVSSAILAAMNPAILGLIALFIVPHVLISHYAIARPMTGLAHRAQEETASNATDLSAAITCAETALLYDAQGYLLKRFEQSSLRLRSANMRMRARSAVGSGLLPLLGMGGYLLILLVGGGWISQGALTFGELTAAFQYRGGMLVGYMMLTSCIINIRASLAGISRVNETLSEPLEG